MADKPSGKRGVALRLVEKYGQAAVDAVRRALGNDASEAALLEGIKRAGYKPLSDNPASRAIEQAATPPKRKKGALQSSASAAKQKAKPETEIKGFAVKPTETPTFGITGKADVGQEVLRLKAREMEVDPKLRTQPTGTDPVFDLSQAAYEETSRILPQTDPTIVQAALPRAQAGATYPLGDRMRNVMDLTPQIARRLAEKAQQGRGTSQEYFYHTAPIVRGLEAVDVPQGDATRFLTENFAPAFAGTSPRTATEQNMRNASLLMYLRGKDVPISSELYDQFGNARGYNMMGSHQDLVGQMFAGTHDPLAKPKPSAFLPNTAGDLGYVTADTHNIRGALLAMNEVEPGSISPDFFKTPEARARYAETAQFNPAKDIDDSLKSAVSGDRKMQVEYGPMADVTFEAARQAGIAPGPMQSLGWFGSGADTGLVSATKTIPELMNERINVTAQALGISPAEALRMFYDGKIPLMAEGGLAELSDKYGA